MAGNIIFQALAFFSLPVFTQYLSPDDYGILSYTASIMSLLCVLASLSLQSFIVRHYFELKTDEERKELFGTISIFLLLVNSVLLLLEFLIFPSLLHYFNIKIPFHPYFQIALIINFLDVALIVPLTYFRVTRNPWGYFALSSSRPILSLGLGLVFVVYYKMGVMGRFYGSFIGNFLFFFISVFLIIKISRLRINLDILKSALRFSIPLIPCGVITVAISSTDKIILERYVPLSEIGIYSVGVTLGTVLSIIARGFHFAVEPEIYEAFNHKDFNKKIVIIKNNFLYLLISLGCIIIIFSKEIVMIAISEQFYECYKIIPFFIIGTIFRGVEMFVSTTLFALNKTIYGPVITGISFFINLLGNLILIPYLGILGAASASLVSFVILLIVSVHITSRFAEIQWKCLKDIGLILTTCGISVLLMSVQIGSPVETGVFKLVIVIFISIILGNQAIKKLRVSNI